MESYSFGSKRDVGHQKGTLGKRRNAISMIITLLLCFVICGGCSSKEIVLPKADNVERIELISEKESGAVKVETIEKEEDIAKIIDALGKESRYVHKESVNDQPTNVEDYITLKIHPKNTEDNPGVLYLYPEGKDKFMEQPYEGIWSIPEATYEKVIDYFKN